MNEADEHLLNLIAMGDPEGWRQFVHRYQRRLIAYAASRVASATTAEDLVQETFVAFLKSKSLYRGDGELESFLFQILRHRIVDHFRRAGVNKEIASCDVLAATEEMMVVCDDQVKSASWYLRQEELHDHVRTLLTGAIRKLADSLQSSRSFKELMIAEGIFYAHCRNRDLADWLQVSQNEVAVIKRRLIERLRNEVLQQEAMQIESGSEFEISSDLLAQVWEAQRPSCPKRSTLGKYTLGILPSDWARYIQFHTETITCTFCVANLQELTAPQLNDQAGNELQQRDRLYQSTIGFVTQRISKNG